MIKFMSRRGARAVKQAFGILSLIWLVLLVPAHADSGVRLYMAEEKGCMWCARFNAEIAPIYPKTAEGRFAPLHRFDLWGPSPDNITFSRILRFSPTFILVHNDIEVGRIEGYPGEDMFWGLLGMLIERADLKLPTEN